MLRACGRANGLVPGKADSLDESAFDTARREAYEEIGLPVSDDVSLPGKFTVEHLCELPTNLARTELAVRPCVAYLSSSSSSSSSSQRPASVDVATASASPADEMLIPRLDAKEVAAVFSAPFHNFLRATDEKRTQEAPAAGTVPAGSGTEWYEGKWTEYYGSRWRMHNFQVPLLGQIIALPRSLGGHVPTAAGASSDGTDDVNARRGQLVAGARLKLLPSIPSLLPYRDHPSSRREDDPFNGKSRFRVFGMTARILVDAARLAFGEEPQFECNSHHGDEELIARLLLAGRLPSIRKTEDNDPLTGGETKLANKM